MIVMSDGMWKKEFPLAEATDLPKAATASAFYL
jgi:hypothetical protein